MEEGAKKEKTGHRAQQRLGIGALAKLLLGTAPNSSPQPVPLLIPNGGKAEAEVVTVSYRRATWRFLSPLERPGPQAEHPGGC